MQTPDFTTTQTNLYSLGKATCPAMKQQAMYCYRPPGKCMIQLLFPCPPSKPPLLSSMQPAWPWHMLKASLLEEEMKHQPELCMYLHGWALETHLLHSSRLTKVSNESYRCFKLQHKCFNLQDQEFRRYDAQFFKIVNQLIIGHAKFSVVCAHTACLAQSCKLTI